MITCRSKWSQYLFHFGKVPRPSVQIYQRDPGFIFIGHMNKVDPEGSPVFKLNIDFELWKFVELALLGRPVVLLEPVIDRVLHVPHSNTIVFSPAAF